MPFIKTIMLSPLKTKRFRVIDNNDKVYDFGLKTGKTFIDHQDKAKRDAYIARHMANKKEAKQINSLILSPALLSMFIMWGPSSFEDNIIHLNEKLIAKEKRGAGLTDIRLDFRPEGHIFLQKLGNENIRKIILQRDPIDATVKTALNLISLGGFEAAVKKEGYDKMFHLYMIVHLANGAVLLIEKNAVVEISNRIRRHQYSERFPIIVSEPITLNEMINNARRNMGDAAFFGYNAFHNNCQNFIMNLLDGVNLLTPQALAFIQQDALSLLKHMPKYVQNLSYGITKLAAVLDKFIY